MFKAKELNNLHKSLEYSINHLEDYLDKHKEYISTTEKIDMMKELENYRYMSIKIENILGNLELEMALE